MCVGNVVCVFVGMWVCVCVSVCVDVSVDVCVYLFLCHTHKTHYLCTHTVKHVTLCGGTHAYNTQNNEYGYTNPGEYEMNEMNGENENRDERESGFQNEYDPRPWEEREDTLFRDDSQGGQN